MNKFSKWTKRMAAMALAIAISVPAGAASAADAKGNVYKVQYRIYSTGSNYASDWSYWLQQYLQSYRPVYTPPTTKQPAAPKPSAPTTQQPAPKPSTPSNPQTGSSQTAATSQFASQVVTLVNQERAKAGLSPLSADAALNNMALVKAKDMYHNNYFSHNSPTYGSPFDMMKSFGISYRYAGENIAKGQRSPQEVMNAWMNSSGHRANILSKNFTKIGVAHYNGVWVQVFTG